MNLHTSSKLTYSLVTIITIFLVSIAGCRIDLESTQENSSELSTSHDNNLFLVMDRMQIEDKQFYTYLVCNSSKDCTPAFKDESERRIIFHISYMNADSIQLSSLDSALIKGPSIGDPLALAYYKLQHYLPLVQKSFKVMSGHEVNNATILFASVPGSIFVKAALMWDGIDEAVYKEITDALRQESPDGSINESVLTLSSDQPVSHLRSPGEAFNGCWNLEKKNFQCYIDFVHISLHGTGVALNDYIKLKTDGIYLLSSVTDLTDFAKLLNIRKKAVNFSGNYYSLYTSDASNIWTANPKPHDRASIAYYCLPKDASQECYEINESLNE
ncbi:MAG: hypothetical protein OXC44_07070 [Proteobacteria bacterium]|nr:hypothetical protein [Pseudomonadota bacterium]